MNQPLVLLVDPDVERRRAIGAFFERERFQVLGASLLDSARNAAIVSPRLVALSLFSDPDGMLPYIAEWRLDPDRARVPLVAITPAADIELANAALTAGADVVIPWPSDDAFLRGRLRALDELGRLRSEVDTFSHVLASIVQAVEAREPYSIEHAQRVGEIAVGMAGVLGFSAEEKERIGRASRLYDIGMVAIPDRIAFGDQVISRDELAEIRAHPVVGYQLLRVLPSLESILPFVHRHHERIDGSGYPDGLVGKEIPVPVQVLSVADAYDVLTSARPYRPVRPPELALEILLAEGRRGVWDGELVAALEKTLEAAARRTV